MSMCAVPPRLFGHPDAEVSHEACQCNGDTECQAIMSWESVEDDAARASSALLQSRISQARLEEIQRTVADLVSGDGLEVVLARVLAAAARAVTALSYVLVIRATSTSDRWVCSEGIDDMEGAQIAERLSETSISVSSNVCFIEVKSDRKRYGYILATGAELVRFDSFEKSVLESYAGLAASALDSYAAIADAHQQATTAQALLALSSALAEVFSIEEMILRLTHAIPSIVGCDRVAVWLTAAGAKRGKVSACFGFNRATELQLGAFALSAPSFSPDKVLRHELTVDRSALTIGTCRRRVRPRLSHFRSAMTTKRCMDGSP
jgi:hypothetical protein